MYDLYKKIEELCEERGIKVGRMCNDIGIQRSVMGNLSAGRSKTLSQKNIQLIASYLEVPVDTLLDTGESYQEQEITDGQLMFALFGEVEDGLITKADLEDVKKYAGMVRLRKMEEKRKKEGK